MLSTQLACSLLRRESGVEGSRRVGTVTLVDRQRVTSTSLASVGFDPATNQLEIEFAEGGIYRYAVPRRIHQELMASDSMGAFFARRIRHTYPGWRVGE